MTPSDPPDTHSDGTLLGGRIAYRQPSCGYRTGIEPVLLAASVPATAGERVVEAGTGAGAGLLSLAARVPGVTGLGIERDGAMAALARENLAANGCRGLDILTLDVTAWRDDGAFDRALANPPWHAETGSLPPQPGRRTAKIASPGLLGRWAASLGRSLRRRGTLSLILPAAVLVEGMAALSAADCPEVTILPLWPRRGTPARLVILCGTRQGRGACRVMPGLVLHRADGGYTPETEDVLRGGAALP